MCGRLVNLDTVARVLAEYYHIKTDTQLVALNEALSKVPAVSVGGSHGKDHIADPGKMVGDLISRQAAIDALLGITAMRNTIPLDSAIFNIKKLPSAQTGRQKGKWLPDNNNYYEERFICSVCGKSYKVDTCMGKPMWDFCPCGADMMEDGDGNG